MAEWESRNLDGITVDIPPGWSVGTDMPGLELVVSAPEKDAFRSNVGIARGQAREKSVEAEFTRQLAELRALLTDSVLLDQQETRLNGLPAQQLLVTFRQGIYELIMKQWLVFDGGRIAVVTACSTQASWDDDQENLHRVVESLRF